MTKVQILVPCDHCQGKAYLPVGEALDAHGQPYVRHTPCPHCEGLGQRTHWISLEELARLLVQTQCPHVHTSFRGGMRFDAGDVWDDIREVCDDCGATLQGQTLADYIIDHA